MNNIKEKELKTCVYLNEWETDIVSRTMMKHSLDYKIINNHYGLERDCSIMLNKEQQEKLMYFLAKEGQEEIKKRFQEAWDNVWR